MVRIEIHLWDFIIKQCWQEINRSAATGYINTANDITIDDVMDNSLNNFNDMLVGTTLLDNIL